MLSDLERRILVESRRLIKNGIQKYVCYAIRDLEIYDEKYVKVSAAKSRLTKYIVESLGNHCTLGSWMSRRNGNTWPSDDDQRKARIAWISWMLGAEVVLDAATKHVSAQRVDR